MSIPKQISNPYLCLFFMVIVSSGCEQSQVASNSTLNVSLPSQMHTRSLPASCSGDFSRADISIDNKLFNTLQRQESNASWHGSFQIPSGKHLIGIRFVCVVERLNGQREEITLATSSKEYDSSSGNNINFTSDDYFLPDNNGDKKPNITELADGTEPGPEPSTPTSIPIQITHENWQDIYKSAMERVEYIASTSIASTKSTCIDRGSMQETLGATLNGYSETDYVFQDCLANAIQLDGTLTVRQPQPSNTHPVDLELASDRLEISNTQEIIITHNMHIKTFNNIIDWHQDINLNLVTPQGRVEITTEQPMTGGSLNSNPNSGEMTIRGANNSFVRVTATGSNQDATFSVNNGTSTIGDTIPWSELGWELIRFSK